MIPQSPIPIPIPSIEGVRVRRRRRPLPPADRILQTMLFWEMPPPDDYAATVATAWRVSDIHNATAPHSPIPNPHSPIPIPIPSIEGERGRRRGRPLPPSQGDDCRAHYRHTPSRRLGSQGLEAISQ